jgi:hypothetical protein
MNKSIRTLLYFLAITLDEEISSDGGAYYAFYVDNDPPPAWVQDAIIHQILADRFFSPSNDFPKIEAKPSLKSNGTLRGMIESWITLLSLRN